MLRLGRPCALPPAPPGRRTGGLGKQHGQCISGGQSGPRIEAESQAEQGQGHASGSQEQLQAQEQEKQSLLEAESSCDCHCTQEQRLLLSWALAGPSALAPCKVGVRWPGRARGPAGRERAAVAIREAAHLHLPTCRAAARLPVEQVEGQEADQQQQQQEGGARHGKDCPDCQPQRSQPEDTVQELGRARAPDKHSWTH